jgi:hypothetical protein
MQRGYAARSRPARWKTATPMTEAVKPNNPAMDSTMNAMPDMNRDDSDDQF